MSEKVFTSPLKHIVSNDEYYLFGPNKTIINWIKSSVPYKTFFLDRNISLDELVCAIEKSNKSKMIEYSSIVMEKLWFYYAGLGPYPFIDILGKFQYDRVFYDKYRDHVCHQLKVFLLGLYIFDQCDTIRTPILHEIEKDTAKKNDIEEFHLRWTVAALYHDIGYIFENPDGKSAEGECWKKIKSHIEEVYEAPLSNTRAFGVNSYDEARMILDEKEIIVPRASWAGTPDELRWHWKRDLIMDLKNYGIKTNLGSEDDRSSNPILSYFDFCRKFESEGRNGFIDHGIFGAILLLKTWQTFNDYMNSIKRTIDSNETPNAIIDCIPNVLNSLEINEKTLLAAAGAICVHNIIPNQWNKADAISHSLTLDRFCIMLKGEKALPLSFLLAVSDSLQEWDRPSYSCPARGASESDITDQHMTLSASNNNICISYKDSKKYGKLKKNLLEYLENSIIEKLLVNKQAGESIKEDNPEDHRKNEIIPPYACEDPGQIVEEESDLIECDLINRTKETRFIINLINDESFKAESRPKILQITGKPGIGKTKILKWALHRFDKDFEESGVIPVYIDLGHNTFHINEMYIISETIFNTISSYVQIDEYRSNSLREAIRNCKKADNANIVANESIKKSHLEANLTNSLLEWLKSILENYKICLLLDSTDDSYLYVMNYLIVERIIKPIFKNFSITKNDLIVISAGRVAYDWGELNDYVHSLEPLDCFISNDIKNLINIHLGPSPFEDYDDLVDITWQLTLGFPATSCCFILNLLPNLKSCMSKDIYHIYPQALRQSVEEVIKKRVLSGIRGRYASPDPYEVLKHISILRKFEFRQFHFILNRLIDNPENKSDMSKNNEYLDSLKENTYLILDQNNTYRVDKVVRYFLREHFRVNNKDKYLSTHKEYAEMYYQWIKKKIGPALYVLDYIYHKSCYLIESSRTSLFEPLDKSTVSDNSIVLKENLEELGVIRFSEENFLSNPNDYMDLLNIIKTIHTDPDLQNLKDSIDLNLLRSTLEQFIPL